MLMGLPFLVFGVSDALPIIVAAVIVFVFGLTPLTRMVAALALMGPPFLILGVADAVPIVIGIVVCSCSARCSGCRPCRRSSSIGRRRRSAAPTWARSARLGGAAFALAPLRRAAGPGPRGDEAMWALIAGDRGDRRRSRSRTVLRD